MKRRYFIKSFTALSVAGTKMPLMAFGRANKSRKPSGDWNPDRIVLLIKLNGGNDGLNTLIPIQDSIYYNLNECTLINHQDEEIDINGIRAAEIILE